MSKRIPLVAAAVAATVLLASGTDAWAQVQSSAQQKCLNALNKDGVAVARTQGKNNVACLKAAGKGTLVGTAQACLTSSPKVTKAQSKTTADDAKLCGTAPSFGYTDAATVNTAAAQGEVDLVADVFGAPLDAAVLSCGSNKAGCACQQKVQKGVEQLAAVKLSEFLKCKKAALKAGASSATALRNCVNDVGTIGSIAADTKGKIQKTITKLKAIIAKSCDTPGVTPAAFPNGTCSGLMNGPLGDCLDVRVECRVCQMINEMDALFVNCDLFDDQAANASCASGTGPSPTPTPTPTPTATATAQPGTIFLGAIARTSGLMNYDGVNGLPGAEIECDDHFPGSHVCTFAELEAAEALGELAGATDVNALPVNTFWAVIPGADANVQCVATVGTLRWFYGTAHTNSEGLFAPLDNGTGSLSSVQTSTCVGGSNNGGACTTQANCPGANAHCGGPTVECTGGLFSVGCCAP